MAKIQAKTAKSNLSQLIERVADSRKPLLIAGPRSKAVLVSEADWRAIQETLHLLAIPGMRESIRRGLKTPVGKCRTTLRW